MSILYTLILNDIWSFYFHDYMIQNWSIDSFQIYGANISNVDDFISILECFKYYQMNVFHNEGTYITYMEDEFNKDGGCFSYKLYNDNFIEKFFEILSLMLGENLGINK